MNANMIHNWLKDPRFLDLNWGIVLVPGDEENFATGLMLDALDVEASENLTA